MTDPAPPLHVLTQNRRRVEGITIFQEIFDGLVLEVVNKGFIEKENILRGEYYDPDGGGDVTPEAIRASTQSYFEKLEVETKTDQ